MNGKRYSSLLFGLLAVSLILLGIPLKASAYHSGSESDLAANPELITFRNFGAGSADNTLALNPELAFSRSFSVSGSPVLKVDSVRWSALGFYYAQKMAMLRGAEADSARWVAMGDKLMARGRDVDSARWVAMGDKLMARGRDVDSARWVALGASYGASIVFNPELILSRSYDDLASNPELLSLQKYETCGC
jgi:hypothetical protein